MTDEERRARQREATRRWRAKNPDHDKTPEHREKERQRALRRYAENPEKERERSRIKAALQRAKRKTDLKLYAFEVHKNNARQRGIPFLLSFDQWWAIWDASGRWDQRGDRRGEYVMARFGDLGPYQRGNVRICTVKENHAERLQRLHREGHFKKPHRR